MFSFPLQALDFPMPYFAHVSLILAPDRSKLSKRHGATSVGQVGFFVFCVGPIAKDTLVFGCLLIL